MARNKFDVDEELEQEFNKEHYQRLFQYVKPYKKTNANYIVCHFNCKYCDNARTLFY